jgi:sulfur carrier protein
MSASQSDTGSGPENDSSSTIRLLVNDEEQSLASPSTVTELLAHLGMAGRRVAVAVNRSVVVRSSHGETHLSDGDRIEILEAVGGG